MRGIRIACQHEPIPAQQGHGLAGGEFDHPVEIVDILQIDGTDHEAEHSMVRTIDPTRQIDGRRADDAAVGRAADEWTGVVRCDEMAIVVTVGKIQVAIHLLA